MKRKKIGISQRRDPVPNREEVRDGLDVRLVELLWVLGFTPVPLVSQIHDLNSYITELDLDGYILSGGNDIGTCSERDHLECAILDSSKKANLPVLGICRGMQMINHYQGGSLTSLGGHVAKKHNISGQITNYRNYAVNSYHKYGIYPENLGADLTIVGICDDESIEAISHNVFPWLGIMWHPEREEKILKRDKVLICKHFGGAP